MMKTQRTIYHLIVDRSGSMSDCIDATINGFNEQISRIHSMTAEFPEQDIRVGITMFNDQVKHLHMAQSVENMPLLNRSNYIPNNSTALLDAIGQTAILLEEKFSLKGQIPTTFVVVVLTDGYENISQLFNLGQIRSLIRRLEDTGKWTFSFIGSTLDAVDVAEQMAFKADNSYSFSKNAMKTEVWDKLSTSVYSYLKKKSSGEDLSDFYKDKK